MKSVLHSKPVLETEGSFMKQVMIDIPDLLALDGVTSSLSIADVFGDSYLIQHNVIYRNVRASAINEGFRFITDSNNALWVSYQLMSLTCLDEIMQSKCFPCFPNKQVLRRLNGQNALNLR